ncbi:MAG TPA: LacI family DNA-binding transcriptional regulator [Chthoniobacteraceae bacterium]|nr:LacI family DNA-binding transcriptional regulator [Chthoniobacteraceae bacterium]
MKHQKLSIKELAEVLQLSRAAVSQALSGNPSTTRISEATRRRVQRAAKKYGYRSNRVARSLRTGKSGMVGILISQSFFQISLEHLKYIHFYCKEHGFIPIIQSVDAHSPEMMSHAVETLLDSKVDAVVLVLLHEFRLLEILSGAGIPVLSVGMPAMDGVPRYYPDKASGFQRLAEHLIEQDNTRLTLMAGERDSNSHSSNAREGVEKAVQAASARGLNVSWEVIPLDLENPDTVEKLSKKTGIHPICTMGYEGMRETLKLEVRPHAVLCSNDNWAQGALRACAEAGVRVPQEIAISGFDNDPTSSAGLVPITSVGHSIRDIYKLAFGDLNAALNDGEPLVEKATVLPCELFARQSTLFRRA